MNNIKLNNNGDSQASLIKEITEAHSKLSEAIEAINKLTIHGRNYQTCEDPEIAFNSDKAWKGTLHHSLEGVQQQLHDAALTIIDQK